MKLSEADALEAHRKHLAGRFLKDCARDLGVNYWTLYMRLKSRGLPIINRKAYSLDRATIERMYFEEKKSQREIGEILGISRHAIDRRFDKWNLVSRPKGFAQTSRRTNLLPEHMEIIDGCLLGDASVYKQKLGVTPAFAYGSTEKGIIDDLQARLPLDFRYYCSPKRIRTTANGETRRYSKFHGIENRTVQSLIAVWER